MRELAGTMGTAVSQRQGLARYENDEERGKGRTHTKQLREIARWNSTTPRRVEY